MATTKSAEPAKPVKPESSARAAVTPIRLLCDYWDEDNIRHKADSILDVSVEAAKVLITRGDGVRADPFPGE